MGLKIVSGGQTGVDQAALRAAKALGIPTGGWAPAGWETEDGPAPWLADYGLRECPIGGYPARTAANVRDSSATLWLGPVGSRGFMATQKAAKIARRPFVIDPFATDATVGVIGHLVAELARSAAGPIVLNVAGNRESGNPGAGKAVETYLRIALARYAPEPATS